MMMMMIILRIELISSFVIFTFMDRLTSRVGSGHDFRGSGPENGFVCNSEDTTGSKKAPPICV